MKSIYFKYLAGFIGLSLMMPIHNAHAVIEDDELAKMVQTNTECTVDNIERSVSPDGQLIFQIDCSNLIFYPDGIRVGGQDPDKRDSCTITKEELGQRHVH